MQFWKELEGNTVAGRYRLRSLLRSNEQSAWFATEDDRQKPWTIFLTDSQSDEDQLLKNLEAASHVKHANVVCVEKTGRARVGNRPVVFAVLEPTEENLDEILKERALTPEETAQITSSLVAGLGAIHEQGLFHGQVNPANVLASGDTVKLSIEWVQKPAAEARGEAQAQDTGDLGATVFQALTQRSLTSPEDPEIKKLPIPFRSIVQSAVTGRWGLADIAAALKKPSLEELRHPVPNVEPGKPKFAEEPVAKAGPKMQKTQAAIADATVVKPAPGVLEAVNGKGAGTGKRGVLRVIAVIALLAAIGVVWFFYHSRTAAAPDTSETAAVPAASSSTAAPSVPAAPKAHIMRPSASHVDTPAGDHRIWRVVVYAFGSQGAAQRKVGVLMQAHPELKPEVFSATGAGPWLVTVGGAMDREQAFQLRGEVKAQGLPGDSYAQNYSH